MIEGTLRCFIHGQRPCSWFVVLIRVSHHAERKSHFLPTTPRLRVWSSEKLLWECCFLQMMSSIYERNTILLASPSFIVLFFLVFLSFIDFRAHSFCCFAFRIQPTLRTVHLEPQHKVCRKPLQLFGKMDSFVCRCFSCNFIVSASCHFLSRHKFPFCVITGVQLSGGVNIRPTNFCKCQRWKSNTVVLA